MTNQLSKETSPYLLQHVDNPVHWHPWGEEALAKAQRENKPIFLSIGYSACHWCHVMAHESFEDEATAAIMNQHFVNIKVDREERPDLDQIYMSAVQMMTGRGGWPMSVFLSPDGVPFYGGTYFPPVPRHGMPAFPTILQAIAKAWRERRQELLEGGAQLIDHIGRQAVLDDKTGGDIGRETLDAAFEEIKAQFDQANAGWGDGPKFPQPMALEFLLRYHQISGDEGALSMVTQTLEAMARGGIYDQLGGGFHRYSVDDHWLVPHFEKMLYDNAQLARVYLHAWQVTGESFFRTICEEILDYVQREMTDSAGGFYSTQDADSEGEEGKFFVWTPTEIQDILAGEVDGFFSVYPVSNRGNFEGSNILTYAGDLAERPALAMARRELLSARQQRIRPGRDEKVLASWNGLMLAAFAEAARVLDRDDYLQTAELNAQFLLHEMRDPERDGRLLRTWKACSKHTLAGHEERLGTAKLNAYLEDYTHVIDGLIELYQSTFESRWYVAARELADLMIAHFAAPAGFFDTSDDHEELIIRPREVQDNATPSGNGMAATVLLRLAGLAVEPLYSDLAERSLASMKTLMARYPLGFGQWLIAAAYSLAKPREVAILGDSNTPGFCTMLSIGQAGYRPHQVVAAGLPEDQVPLLTGRKLLDGEATAYVCVDFTCRQPVSDPDQLGEILEEDANRDYV